MRMPKMPKRKTSKAKERKVADLSEHCEESQTKLNFSTAKDSGGHQGKSSQADSLGEVDVCVARKEEKRARKRPPLVEGGGPLPDSLGNFDTYSKAEVRPCSTSLSSRLHQCRILAGSAGAVGSQCSASGVATKRRTVRVTLNPRQFTPKYNTLPPPSRQPKAKKSEVCVGGRTTTNCDDYLPLVGGAKKLTVREESVVLLDSEEEEQQERGDRSQGDKEVVHTANPKGSTLGQGKGEERDAVTVVDDSQDSEDNVSVIVAKAPLSTVQDGAGERLRLSAEKKGEGDMSEPEPMDTISSNGADPQLEEMEVGEKTASASASSVSEGSGHVSVVEMVLLSDEEKCVASEQTRSSSTPSKKINGGGGGSFPPSPVPSKISEMFRVTPSKPTRKRETTPTEQWEPLPVCLSCAPRKRSKKNDLDSSSASGEEEGSEKRRTLSEKKRQLQEKKDFGEKEKEFSGKEKVLQRKQNQRCRDDNEDDDGNEEVEQVELGEGTSSSKAAQPSRKRNVSGGLFRKSGIAGSGWEEDEEDPLVIEESDSQVMSSRGVEAEDKDAIESVEDGLSPQRGGEGSISSPGKTSTLQTSPRKLPVDTMTAELRLQKSLSLRHRHKPLSPIQQGLHEVTSAEEEEGSGVRSFYRGGRGKTQAATDPTWKNSRQPQRKGATLSKGKLFKLRNEAGNVQVKKWPANSTTLSTDDAPAQANPFSKGGTGGGKHSVQSAAPRLSTEFELLSNDQQLSAGDIQLGSLQMVATSPLHISCTGVSVSALANGVLDTLDLQLRWDDIFSVKLHWKTLPSLLVLRPSNAGASNLQSRLLVKRIKGTHIKADGKDPVQRYIVIQIPKQVHQSVKEGILEILQQQYQSSREFILTVEETESFLKMVSAVPARRTSEHNLRQPQQPRPTSALSTSDPFSDSDDSSMPDVPASFTRHPVKTYGQSSVNLCTESQRPRRRSARTTPGFKLPSDLPHIDFTFRPQSGNQAIRCLSDDLHCLEEGEFLNDTIINFYLMYLWDKLPADKRDTVLILSSFFFTRLSNTKLDGSKGTERTPEREHARVKNWTKSVDIFSKSILIVPVCYLSHWFLFIVMHAGEYDKERRAREVERKKLLQRRSKRKSCPGSSGSGWVTAPLDVHTPQSEATEDLSESQEGKEDSIDITTPVADEANTLEEETKQSAILVLDSLGARRPKLSWRLVKYLNEEWRCKKNSEDNDHFQGFPILYPQVPLQPNSSDCGIYLLHFVQELFEGLGSVQPDATGGQLKWSDPPNEFRRQLFTLVTEMNSQKDVVPQTAHAQNVTDL